MREIPPSFLAISLIDTLAWRRYFWGTLLPRAGKRYPEADRKRLTLRHRNGKSRILFVEDDEVLRAMLAPQLESAGYDLSVARDGREAMKLVDQDTPDLVILDIMLPLRTHRTLRL